jgi:hypothetical protein
MSAIIQPLLLTWRPNVGQTIVLNSMDYPINETLEFEMEFTDPSVKKMQQGGEWPSFGYPMALKIVAEGSILGTTRTEFWNNRMVFLDSLTPPNRSLTERQHGRLTITDEDAPEGFFAPCRVVNRVANLEALSPSRCPYMVTFKAFTPYFQGLGSGKAYVPG